MLRRLLAQFGLTALLMALGTGAVFADTASPATPQPTDPGHSVVSNSDTAAVVTISQNSTTNVGTTITGPTDGSNGNPPAATPPAAGGHSATLGDSAPSNATPALLTSTNHSAAAQTPIITPSQPGGGGTNSPMSLPVAASSNGLVASLQRAAYISGLSPVEPMLPTNLGAGLAHPASSKAPPAPVGFLSQLHILLISTLVPTIRLVPGAAQVAATTVGLAIAALLILAALARLGDMLSPNSYTARLRRSGFLGAARSDVATLLLFATPREMGSIGAGAPG